MFALVGRGPLSFFLSLFPKTFKLNGNVFFSMASIKFFIFTIEGIVQLSIVLSSRSSICFGNVFYLWSNHYVILYKFKLYSKSPILLLGVWTTMKNMLVDESFQVFKNNKRTFHPVDFSKWNAQIVGLLFIVAKLKTKLGKNYFVGEIQVLKRISKCISFTTKQLQNQITFSFFKSNVNSKSVQNLWKFP